MTSFKQMNIQLPQQRQDRVWQLFVARAVHRYHVQFVTLPPIATASSPAPRQASSTCVTLSPAPLNMALTDVTALLNASEATYSMAIGGIAVPTDGGVYALNLLATELSSMHNKNILLLAQRHHQRGFEQATYMASVQPCMQGDEPTIVTASQRPQRQHGAH